MAIAESFHRLGWKGIDEAVGRVRQIDAKVMQPDLLVRDITIRLAKIRPRAIRAIPKWRALARAAWPDPHDSATGEPPENPCSASSWHLET